MSAGFALFLIDTAMVAVLWPLTVWLAWAVLGIAPDWLQTALLGVLNLLFQYALGLYRREAVANKYTTLSRIPMVVMLGVASSSFAAIVLGWRLSPALYVLAMCCFASCAILTRLLFRILHRHSIFRPRLLIIGAGARVWDLLRILRTQGRHFHYVITLVHEENFGPVDSRLADDKGVKIISAGGNIVEVAARLRADQIVVAPDERRGMALDSLISCRAAGYPVYEYMSFLEKEVGRIDIKRLDQSWVLFSSGFETGLVDRALKRLLDLVVSFLILFFSLPFLLPAMAAVWLTDRGPIFYRQVRVTQAGRKFQILKLRSMRVNAEANGAVWAAVKDSRITPVGDFLRRTRLDELPQLFNVIKGDMSLVGPRPERPEFIENLVTQLPLYQERHAVKAGLTGWAQVNYPYGASLDDARSKLSYDLYYVKNFSIFLDVSIILQTLRVVLWPSAGGAR
jgi:sugar transferase (PEP-CTERM system associated)